MCLGGASVRGTLHWNKQPAIVVTGYRLSIMSNATETIMSKDDPTFADEIESTFAALSESAEAFDRQLESAANIIKPIVKSFNMQRVTVMQTALGVVYLQGLPGKKALALLQTGEKVGLDDLLPFLLDNNVVRFRTVKGTDVSDTGIDTYRKLALEGKYGIDLANAYAAARDISRPEGLRDLMGIKPKDEVVESIKGITYAKGIKAYVKNVRNLMTRLEALLPEGTDPVLQIYPDTELERGDKEIKAILEQGMADLQLDDL